MISSPVTFLSRSIAMKNVLYPFDIGRQAARLFLLLSIRTVLKHMSDIK